MSQVGEPRKRITVEPVEEPVPSKQPVEAPAQPEKVPAKS